MNISQYNYEAYFLDYYEGTLSAEATRELMDFLAQHPELKQEFESFEAVTLSDVEEIKLDNKESLKKFATAVNASNFDEVAAQYVDGTLTIKESNELATFIKLYPEYEKELATYKLTKLSPDTSIFFEDKDSLKRNNRRATYYYWSAAASVAIIIAGYFIINRPVQPIVTVANINKPADTTHVRTTQNNTNVAVVQPTHTVAPVKTFVIRKEHAPVQNLQDTESIATTVNKQNVVVQAPAPVPTPIIDRKDSTVNPDRVAFNSPKDTVNTNMLVKHDSFVKHINNPDSIPEQKSSSVFAFASNTIKGIGKIFKSGGVGFHKYYSPEDANKVIAYQFTVGDNRYTLAKK